MRRPSTPKPDGRLSGCYRVCVQCGRPHSDERRRTVVSLMLPATYRDVLDAFPCLFSLPDGSTDLIALFAAFLAIGAVEGADGEWELP